MSRSKFLASSSRSFVLLAPSLGGAARGVFPNVSYSHSRYSSLQAEMQRLRGRLYLEDGAIQSTDLTSDGRHVLPTDERSWHLLTTEADGKVVGCTRYMRHSGASRFEDLALSHSALADSDIWGTRLRSVVGNELNVARAEAFSYVEVGGWAMDRDIRCTTECLRSVLATYAWSRLLGGALGITTATERNGSATILRKLGGQSLAWNDMALPGYFDPLYNCRMQMLRFDSRQPNARYEPVIDDLQHTLMNAPVICAERPASHSPGGIVSGGFVPDAMLAGLVVSQNASV